jgi:hypothetical protein
VPDHLFRTAACAMAHRAAWATERLRERDASERESERRRRGCGKAARTKTAATIRSAEHDVSFLDEKG